MLKLVHILPLSVLLFCAWLQLNDPDPAFWVLLYVVSGLVPVLFMIKVKSAVRSGVTVLALLFCLVGIGLSLEGAITYLQYADEEPLMQSMNDEKPYIEEARELIGVLIALVIIAGYWMIGLRKKSASTDQGT